MSTMFCNSYRVLFYFLSVSGIRSVTNNHGNGAGNTVYDASPEALAVDTAASIVP